MKILRQKIEEEYIEDKFIAVFGDELPEPEEIAEKIINAVKHDILDRPLDFINKELGVHRGTLTTELYFEYWDMSDFDPVHLTHYDPIHIRRWKL